MQGPLAESTAVVLLVATLAFAVVRPGRLPEALVAVPAAVLLLLAGVLPLKEAAAEAQTLGPTVGFLAAVLVFADLCERHGLFQAAGAWMARTSRARPLSLLNLVFVVASVVTAMFSLDATVLLLTPIVLTTVARLRLRPKPYAYACTHLANSASLLLPVSNLTNLLALRASGLSFAHFAGLMTLPWLAAIGVEWLVLRRTFSTELVGRGEVPPMSSGTTPVFAGVIVVLTLIGFFLASAVNLNPAFVAAGGAALLAFPALTRRRTSPGDLLRAADVPFLLFVISLSLIVRAMSLHGLSRLAADLVPHTVSLGTLMLGAVAGAVLANLINNIPAVLMLVPAAAAAGPGEVLAILIGVNAGPNLTYVGSLATLLWRRVLHQHGEDVSTGEFLRLGATTVPLVLIAATFALWVALRLVG